MAESKDYNSYLGHDLSELIILAALKYEDLSAYKLIKKIKERTNGKIRFRAGTIYPQMEKIEKNELIERKLVDTSRVEGITRQKSIYRITKNGIKVLNRRKEEWDNLKNVIDQLVQMEVY